MFVRYHIRSNISYLSCIFYDCLHMFSSYLHKICTHKLVRVKKPLGWSKQKLWINLNTDPLVREGLVCRLSGSIIYSDAKSEIIFQEWIIPFYACSDVYQTSMRWYSYSRNIQADITFSQSSLQMMATINEISAAPQRLSIVLFYCYVIVISGAQVPPCVQSGSVSSNLLLTIHEIILIFEQFS